MASETGPEIDDGTEALTYAERPAAGRRGGRWLAVGTCVALALLAAWAWGPGLAARWAVLAYQQQCLDYAAPAGAVVADLGWPAGGGAVPACWQSFVWYGGGGRLRSDGTVFLHGVRTPGGARRLVAVDVQRDASGQSFLTTALVPRVFVPAGLWAAREEPSVAGLGFDRSLASPTRFYAGQVDPADASHFTIRFQAAGGPGVIDGWLKEDGSVLLAVR